MADMIRLKYDLRMEAQNTEADILVYGEICSYKWDDTDMTAKDFDQLLKDAKKNGATKLRLRINSPGGSVFQAVAMRAMLLNSGFDEVNVDIEGLCASAATLFVCVPGAHVRIAEGSEFMIHNPYTIAWGNAGELEKEAEHLRKMEADFRAMYAERTGLDEDAIKNWMDAETWFTAQEAVDASFADEIMQGREIAACAGKDVLAAMRGMYRNVPGNIGSGDIEDSNTITAPAASDTDNKNEEEAGDMEITEITMDMLRTGNPELYNTVMQAGAAAERERIRGIDDLTMPGYEAMAEEAKRNGTDAMAFHKQMAEAMRKKGAEFVAQRKAETEPAASVTGGDAANGKTEEDEIADYAKDAAKIASELRPDTNGMF